nr:choice-of-anchor Q domain-containing protein [Allochromatium palmeri]
MANDDLSLLSNSPMINAGDPMTSGLPATDAAGHPRLVGEIVDIGAYENPTGDPSLAGLNVGLEGDGDGTVTSMPAGIDCGIDCNTVFAAGTEVTVTATPASDNDVFTGWSGACSGADPTCTLTLNEATVVIATFVKGYAINARVTPSGAGTIVCDPNPVPSGQSSLCIARPASGYGFTAWSSGCNSTDNHTCTLTTVTGTRSVTAEFTGTADLTATQEVATSYTPGGLLTVTAQFNDISGAEARGLTWLPELPSGWTVISATGGGSPQVSNNEILFTGTLTLPINFSYQIRVPEDARGDQQMGATLNYQSADMGNPVTLLVEPDPLLIGQVGVVRHSADYQDPAWNIDATEASRVLAYWREQAYQVDASNPDGYALGSGNTEGAPHSADYREPQWRIDTFEVNRVLGYWRAPSYYVEPQGDDGYAPGGQQVAGTASKRAAAISADTTAPQATQAASVGYYTPGETLTIVNTLGQTGDDPLLSLVWVPTLPSGWTLSGVSGSGSPELSPAGTEILFTASGELTLPLTFSYSVQVPETASGSQAISAEFTYQRLGMINEASATPTPNPLVIGDTEETGGCATTATTLTTSVTSGTLTQRSEIGIQVAGSVSVASGATLDLTAPRITFAPSFRVEAGGRLMATSAPVTCTAAASAQNTAALIASAPAAVAPGFIAGKDALPSWLQEHLAELSIDTDALTGGLLDADERWLILETTQTLHPEDGNEASDLYRLDLLTDHIALISVTEDGSAGNGASRDPAADTLGERVVFSSAASDLVPGDDNGVSDLFLRDLALGVTERLTQAEQASAHPAVDAEGTVLVYDQASLEGPRQILGQALIDGPAAEIVPLSEGEALADAHHPGLSTDGRFLAYLSQSVAADGAQLCAISIRDLVSGIDHRQACPAELLDASDWTRPTFSPDGGTLYWYQSGQDQLIALPNPLAERFSQN